MEKRLGGPSMTSGLSLCRMIAAQIAGLSNEMRIAERHHQSHTLAGMDGAPFSAGFEAFCLGGAAFFALRVSRLLLR